MLIMAGRLGASIQQTRPLVSLCGRSLFLLFCKLPLCPAPCLLPCTRSPGVRYRAPSLVGARLQVRALDGVHVSSAAAGLMSSGALPATFAAATASPKHLSTPACIQKLRTLARQRVSCGNKKASLGTRISKIWIFLSGQRESYMRVAGWHRYHTEHDLRWAS